MDFFVESWVISWVIFSKKALIDLPLPLAKDVLPDLATKETLSMLNEYERKISGKGTVRGEKGTKKKFPLFILNEDMDDFSKIVEQVENSGLLIDDNTERVKKKIKKQEGWFLGAMAAPMAAPLIAPMVSSLIQPMNYSLVNPLKRKGVMKKGKNICAVFGKKKLTFIKIQEASRLKVH